MNRSVLAGRWCSSDYFCNQTARRESQVHGYKLTGALPTLSPRSPKHIKQLSWTIFKFAFIIYCTIIAYSHREIMKDPTAKKGRGVRWQIWRLGMDLDFKVTHWNCAGLGWKRAVECPGVCTVVPNLALTGTMSLNSVMVPMPGWNLRSSGTVSLQEDSSQWNKYRTLDFC